MPARSGVCSVYVTRREAGVLSLLAQGFGNEEIGVTLGVETSTVKHHIYSAAGKLHVHSRFFWPTTGAVRFSDSAPA
jgi:DNA-binding NarL/FixJ family response regulator